MFLESLYHPIRVVYMIRCLGLLRPWMGLPSWDQAFSLGGSFLAMPWTRHTRSRGWKVHGWTFVLYLLEAKSLVAFSLLLTIYWTSFVVSSSTLIFSSFCCCWNNSLLVDSSLTSTGSCHLCNMWVGKEFHWSLPVVNSGRPRVY